MLHLLDVNEIMMMFDDDRYLAQFFVSPSSNYTTVFMSDAKVQLPGFCNYEIYLTSVYDDTP